MSDKLLMSDKLHMVDMVLADEMVKKQIGVLVSGLIAEGLSGQWPAEADDWECRLADRAHAIVSSHMSRVEEESQ